MPAGGRGVRDIIRDPSSSAHAQCIERNLSVTLPLRKIDLRWPGVRAGEPECRPRPFSSGRKEGTGEVIAAGLGNGEIPEIEPSFLIPK